MNQNVFKQKSRSGYIGGVVYYSGKDTEIEREREGAIG